MSGVGRTQLDRIYGDRLVHAFIPAIDAMAMVDRRCSPHSLSQWEHGGCSVLQDVYHFVLSIPRIAVSGHLAATCKPFWLTWPCLQQCYFNSSSSHRMAAWQHSAMGKPGDDPDQSLVEHAQPRMHSPTCKAQAVAGERCAQIQVSSVECL